MSLCILAASHTRQSHPTARFTPGLRFAQFQLLEEKSAHTRLLSGLWGISSPSFPHPPSTLGTGGHTGAINACVVSVGSGLTSTITGDHSGHGQQSHPKEPPQQVKDWKQSQPAIFYFYLLIKGKLKHSTETDYFKHTAACHAKTGKSPHSPSVWWSLSFL